MRENKNYARPLLLAGGLAVALYLLWLVSAVVIPFFAAWLLAYLLNPVVNFLQHQCRIRFRVIAVILTLLLFIGCLVGLFFLIVPPILEECSHLEYVFQRYYEARGHNSTIPSAVYDFFRDTFDMPELKRYLTKGDLMETFKNIFPDIMEVVYSTASAIFSMVASLISLLYLFFLMLDYDHYARIWITYIPERYQTFARTFVGDVERYFCGYFRGHLLIALSNCVLFSVGFWLFDFPMPLGLGTFIGVISFVPYLQVVGMVPGVLLALLRAIDTGQNFWWLIIGMLVVYIVVQIIQDVLVTPHIMGRIMGLSPAVILLTLSIGGSLLGIMGLILSLPVTTMALIYYRRYVLHEPQLQE